MIAYQPKEDKKMKTVALIEKGQNGTFGIYTPDINTTIIGNGSTVAEAKADFENSVKEILASYEGEELPSELRGIAFEYKYDIASLFDYYNWINVTKFAKVVGINPSLMRQYKQGLTYISEAQASKIEQGLHRIGQELISVSL